FATAAPPYPPISACEDDWQGYGAHRDGRPEGSAGWTVGSHRLEPDHTDPGTSYEFIACADGRVRRRGGRESRFCGVNSGRLDEAGGVHLSIANHWDVDRDDCDRGHELDRPQATAATGGPMASAAPTSFRRGL